MKTKFLPFAILFSVVLGCSVFRTARSFPAPTTKKADFIAQIKRVDCENDNRLRAVERLLSNMGVEDEDIAIEKFEKVVNVVLTIEGKTDETVIVGAHYDKTTLGCGAIDNWTGVVILANLYKEFAARQNEKTYKFVAFGKEEKGLYGSKAMANDIPKSELPKYCGMINFDSFGFNDVWTLGSVSDKNLVDLASVVAARRGFLFETKSFRGASADSKSFRKVNIPAITISGLSDDWKEYLHQDKDQLDNINFDRVFDNFLFSYEFLSEIDARDCASFR